MSTLRRAGRNIFFKAAAEILSRLIYLGFFIFMARKLGAGDFGLFSFAFSFAGIFAILIDPGLNIMLMRDIARDRALARSYGDNIFTLKTILSLITIILVWISVGLLGYDHFTLQVVLGMGVILILNCFLDFFISIFNAHEKMEYDAAVKIINKFLISFFGSGALIFGSGLIGLLTWMSIGSAMAVIISYHFVKKIITKLSMAFDRHLLKELLRKALPLALMMIFSAIYFKVDIVMLSMFKTGNAEIGRYAAAIRLIEILNVIPAIFVGGIFPIMASQYGERNTELEATFKQTFRLLLLIVIPIVATTVIFSKEIIGMIYGGDYMNSEEALRILIWTSFFIFPNVLLTNLIITTNKQTLNAVFTFMCLCLNILLNAVLIPRYGSKGAAIATVVTDMALFLATATFVARYFKNIDFLKSGIKPVMCGICLAVLLKGLHGIHLLFLIPLSAALYLAIILLTRTLYFNDLIHFKNVLTGHNR